MHGGGWGPCIQFFLEDPDGSKPRGVALLCSRRAWNVPVHSTSGLCDPCFYSTWAKPGNLQSSVYSAGVGSSLVLLLPCHSDSIIQVGTFLGSPTQKLHPILWPTGCLPRMSSQGLDLNPVDFLAIYTQFWILPQKFFLGSLNLWWACIPQNAQEACATCGDTNIRAPERRSYN